MKSIAIYSFAAFACLLFVVTLILTPGSEQRWQQEKEAKHCALSLHKESYSTTVDTVINGIKTTSVVRMPGISTYHCDGVTIIREEE